MICTGTYALLETAGVRLALVNDAPEAIRGAVAQALDAARVGFLCPPVCGGHIRIETTAGPAECNLLRAAAFYHAEITQAQGVAFVLTEASGYAAPQAVVANVRQQTASAVLTLPEWTTDKHAARFAGHLYTAWQAGDLLTAEGAALAAIRQMADIPDGTIEVGVAGLEIGLRKEGGAVTGLSAGGPMRLLGTQIWECDT